MVKHSNDVKIMIVDDDDVDAASITRAIKRLKIANPVIRAYDGLDALSKLRGEDNKVVIKNTLYHTARYQYASHEWN